MTALVRPPRTTYVTDGLCVFPYFTVPHSIIRYQRVKCSSIIPRARATCTAHIYSTEAQPAGHGETKSKHLAVKPSSDTRHSAREEAQPAGHSQTKGVENFYVGQKTYIFMFKPFFFIPGPFQGGRFLGEINYSSAL